MYNFENANEIDKILESQINRKKLKSIIPRSLFNIQELGDEEFKKCWNLNNLQPLYWIDNIQKSNKCLVKDIV